MRVLGVDPGLTRCGIGVVDGSPEHRLAFVAAGVVRTAPDAPHELRLLHIAEGLEEWIERYRPDAVAVERVFAKHNLLSVTGTSQAAGLAMLAAARRKLPVVLHTPSEVKAAITGSGTADKAQVGHMVARVLHLDAPPSPADAADAVALAICHVWRGGAVNRYAEAAARVAAARATRPVGTRAGQSRRIGRPA